MTTATLPTQDQVDRIARDLTPDVVRIRLDVAPDWTDDPALFFRVTMSDEAGRRDRMWNATELVRAKVIDELRLEESDRRPYFRFRTQSEQAKLQDPQWA